LHKTLKILIKSERSEKLQNSLPTPITTNSGEKLNYVRKLFPLLKTSEMMSFNFHAFALAPQITFNRISFHPS
jgi:hypothetical protein